MNSTFTQHPWCWNAYTTDTQHQLIITDRLPLNTETQRHINPDGCPRKAQIAIELDDDLAPGPRLYCWICAPTYLNHRLTHPPDPLT